MTRKAAQANRRRTAAVSDLGCPQPRRIDGPFRPRVHRSPVHCAPLAATRACAPRLAPINHLVTSPPCRATPPRPAARSAPPARRATPRRAARASSPPRPPSSRATAWAARASTASPRARRRTSGCSTTTSAARRRCSSPCSRRAYERIRGEEQKLDLTDAAARGGHARARRVHVALLPRAPGVHVAAQHREPAPREAPEALDAGSARCTRRWSR